MHSKAVSILGIAALTSQVAAHGYIRTFTLDGVDYEGYSRSDGGGKVGSIGWTFTTPDEGPVLEPSNPAFACRQGAQPPKSSGTIAAGGQAGFLWTSDDKERNPDGWSQGHHGPILTYLAPCNGDCSSIELTSLRWTKISEKGVTGPANEKGTWATDEMRANGGVATATIPSSIAAGNYIIRHEIIALHRALLNEPEFYGQCANIQITGHGTDDLSGSGVVASQLYSTSETSIYGHDIYDSRMDGADWAIPGPPLYPGAGPSTGPQTPANGTVPSTETGFMTIQTINPSATAGPINDGVMTIQTGLPTNTGATSNPEQTPQPQPSRGGDGGSGYKWHHGGRHWRQRGSSRHH